MAYNTNIRVVERLRPVLDLIIKGLSDSPHMYLKYDISVNWPYRIHEGINAAKVHGVEPYASLKIEIQRRGELLIILNKAGKIPALPIPLTVDEPQESMKAIELPEITTVPDAITPFEVVGYLSNLIKDGEKNLTLTFPNLEGDRQLALNWIERKNLTVLNHTPLTVKI